MCFVWISEQTAIISLYSINWLVCVTETECVYCAVRTGYLNVFQAKSHLQTVNRSSPSITPISFVYPDGLLPLSSQLSITLCP
jgi:hypothetical protein